jgi:monofunctional biosynthetic peptidoglycan transglycosylase
MIKKKPLQKIWRILKKIFLVIFIVHTGWFLIFIIQKFGVSDFIITNLKEKVLAVCAGLLILGGIYYLWLRKISLIHKVAVVTREIFFVLYISSFLYLVLGMIFNPVITLTQAVNIVNGNGLKRDYISYPDMGPNIKLAVMASEDQNYPDHDGFDLKAIKLAMKYNKRHPNKVRGASTISQQTAKNVFLWQGGGFFRKGLEVYFTFSIEKLWTKKTILERYLNIAEMGKGIFGVQAAARAYFNKDAKNLTRMEAAEIAACLPNPQRLSVKPLSNYVASRANAIMIQMGFLEGDPDIQELIR